MMKSIATLVLATVMVAGVSGETRPNHAAAPDGSAAGAVTVTVNYKGKGTVDASHRVWVWLFNTPDIGPASMPIGQMSVEKNGATATFEVTDERVWIAVAFDEKGVMTGNEPPPSGTPIR